MANSRRQSRNSSTARPSPTAPRRYGTLVVSGERTKVKLGHGCVAFKQTCRWSPNRSVLPGLNKNAAVGFTLLSLPEGNRRLLPAGDMNGYSRSALRIGFEILAHCKKMDTDHRQDYLLMLKLHQRLPATKSYLKRQFSSVTDLTIRRSGRDGGRGNSNVLPENLGRSSDGSGKKWSHQRLLEVGRERYAMALQERLTHQEPKSNSRAEAASGQAAIAYGLMAAAELDPLDLCGEQVRQLMRMALFDLGAQRPPNSAEVTTWVTARLRAVWNAHLEDSNPEFDAWFQGGSSNVIKTLANLAGHVGGRLEREDVEWALSELTSQSLWYAADCQNIFAQAVGQSISPRFKGEDKAMFEQWYQPQPYFGGLTLPLLWERSQLLRPILGRIWLDPANARLHGIMWRTIEFYFQMTSTRRYADRKIKSRKASTRRPVVDQRQPRPSFSADVSSLSEWIEVLAVRSGLVCQHRKCKVQYEGQLEPESIVICGHCAQHGTLPLVRLTPAEAKQIIDIVNQA